MTFLNAKVKKINIAQNNKFSILKNKLHIFLNFGAIFYYYITIT